MQAHLDAKTYCRLSNTQWFRDAGSQNLNVKNAARTLCWQIITLKKNSIGLSNIKPYCNTSFCFCH